MNEVCKGGFDCIMTLAFAKYKVIKLAFKNVFANQKCVHFSQIPLKFVFSLQFILYYHTEFTFIYFEYFYF